MTDSMAQRVLSRLGGSFAGALVGVLVASALEARWLRSAESNPPGFVAGFLGVLGLLIPVAIGIGVALGIGSLVLHPEAPPSPRRLREALERGDRGFSAALVPLGAIAIALWVIFAARIGLGFLSSEVAVKSAASAGVLAAVAVAVWLYVLVLGGAKLLAKPLANGPGPVVTGAIGIAVAGALLGYAIYVGTTSGTGGTLQIFGVLKRPELDLRGPGLFLLIAACAYLAPMLVARVPALVPIALALGFLFFTWQSAGSRLSDRHLAIAIERNAPLGKLMLGRLRKLSDRDRDGFSSRFGGGDCNDGDPKIGPGAEDVPGNGVDEDCSGKDAIEVKIETQTAEAPKDAKAWALAKLPEKLNVVLITIDTLRWDLGYMGNSRPLSPNLDKLAKKSVVYENAYSLASYTSKSLPPALIGKYPNETHRGWAHFNRFEPSDIFVQERLQKAGIRTVSVQGYWYFFQKDVGFERGFDVIDSTSSKGFAVEGDKSFNSDKITDAAIGQLQKPENSGRQFYMWVHYVDPHAEYVKHEGFDFGPKSRDLYDSEVAFVDHHVGRLLEFIEKSKFGPNTAIIVTSDHGEAFGEHGLIRHGFEVWEELIRVPLIFHVPGFAARRIAVRRGAIDLVPTILELYRRPLPKPAGDDFLSGQSLLVELAGPPGFEAKSRIVFSHMCAGPNNADRQAYIDNDKKLITSDGRPLGLYDLKKDPGEKEDLLDDAELKENVVGRYRAFVKELKEVKVRAEPK
jgi:arylsulfatase A-like enzyme